MNDSPTKPTPAPNPFGCIGRIDEPDGNFWGREPLLDDIFEMLAKGSNISLVGPVGVGKSSLLQAIATWGPHRLDLPPNTFVYLDMQVLDDGNDFYTELCYRIGIPHCRGSALVRALEGRRCILCLDEIEEMTDTQVNKLLAESTKIAITQLTYLYTR